MSNNPNDLFIEMINKQKEKETNINIWENSRYKDLAKLQKNNVGNVGETFIQNICNSCDIISQIDGSKTKEKGGGFGDGFINNKCVEIKTALRCSSYPSFQHELGETPWKSDYMMFIDIDPSCIYLTIFNNFTEEFYKSGNKCGLYFESKTITWRKNIGAFKLDTTVKINEDNIIKGNTIKITNDVSIELIKEFIILKIK